MTPDQSDGSNIFPTGFYLQYTDNDQYKQKEPTSSF